MPNLQTWLSLRDCYWKFTARLTLWLTIELPELPVAVTTMM